jgi:hypothetical protein
MNAYQEFWIIIASPLLFIYSICEIYRGFYILIKKQYKSNIAYSIRLLLLKTFSSKETADNYLQNILKSPDNIYPSAIYSILGGVTGIIGITWLIIVLFTK